MLPPIRQTGYVTDNQGAFRILGRRFSSENCLKIELVLKSFLAPKKLWCKICESAVEFSSDPPAARFAMF
jgi:hypothetical protein